MTLDVATPQHSAGIARVWAECFPDDPPHNIGEAAVERKLALDDGLLWVALDGDAVVGVILAGYDGWRGWLYHLGVVESHRGRGLARALVEAAVAELKARGCVKVNLQVRESRPDLIPLYEALGFAEYPARSMGRVLHT